MASSETEFEEFLLWSAAILPAATYNDEYLPSQWHLGAAVAGSMGANVSVVWEEFRGRNVVVGVLDDGVEYTHPDLDANYDTTLDYDARGTYPTPPPPGSPPDDDDAYPSDPTDRHGTTVAGVIGAELDNAIGGAGVAPEATLVGYRIGFDNNFTVDQLAAVFERVASLDVANNSWGFGGYLADSQYHSALAPIFNDIHGALEDGRGELGTIVVFAAGNGRAQQQDTNYHSFQNYHGLITVAATNSAGNVASFSTPGASILVAAPGAGIWTTDRVGPDFGYNLGATDYSSMQGTSFAAPIVSGIAALMLEANPGLGWRDVQEILASTAIQTGAVDGWAFNGAGSWNGGAMHVNHDFGFGLVDAMAAVRVAESWRLVSTSANEAVDFAFDPTDVTIPAAGTLTRTLALDGGLRMDHVELDLAVSHSSIAELSVLLTSPTGTQSLLFHNPPTPGSGGIFFTFSTTRDWGEPSDGTWTLSITDNGGSAAGTLLEWEVRAFGDATADDVYVYTEEFGALAAVDFTRLALADTGGTDAINTAAIAADTLLDLRPGQASTIDGQSVTLGAGTVIENADTGDGDDTITGNDAVNWLRGWRGNDALDGGLGTDTLEGGRGSDVLRGGLGDDLYYFDATFGQDLVVDRDFTPGNLDTIRFGEFVATGLIAVSRVSLDLFLAAGADSITVENWFASEADQVERVEFLFDGTTWTATQLRTLSNFAPVLANPVADQAAGIGQLFSFQVSAAFSDADVVIGDTLDYGATLEGGGALPSWLAFDPLDRTFSGTPSLEDAGPVSVTVTATDSYSAAASDTFTITVGNPNTAPVAVDDAIAAGENATTPNLVATLLANDSDADAGDPLRVLAVNTTGTVGAVTFDVGAQTLTYTANAAAHEALAQGATTTDSFSYTVADSANATDAATVSVTITGVNDAPLIAMSLADQNATVGTAFGYTVPAGSFSDVDVGDALGYAASGLPAWLSFDPLTRTFSGTPGTGDVGVATVRLTVTDPHMASVFDEFALSITGGGTVINGTAGNDTLNGTGGPDLIYGFGGDDVLNGFDGDDTLTGGAGGDAMYGGAGDDLFLFAGSDSPWDQVNGGAGFDQILGSAGDDTIRLWDYVGPNRVERIDGGAGVNVIMTYATSTILDLSTTQLVNIARIEGAAGHDTITGSAGNDVIQGGAGGDAMYGGAGDDLFLFAGSDSPWDQVNGGSGFDQILGSAGDDTIRLWDYIGANTVERIDGGAGVNVIMTYATSTTLDLSGTQLVNIARIQGDAGNDTLTGSAGNDVIDGGAGNDTMAGGAGDDTYKVDSTGDTVSEGSGAGTDTVQSFISYTLGVNLENLALLGSASVNATGNALSNVLTGNAAANTLDGAAGADALNGGAGNDLYLFNAAFGLDTIIDSDATAGNVDVVRFGAGIAPESVAASRSGQNLVLAHGAGSVTVENWYTSDADRIERVEFTGSATIWDVATLFAMTGGGGNQPPSATNLTQTKAYIEGASSVGLDDIVVTDIDSGDSITATLTLALPAAGALTTSGAAIYTAGTGVWTVTGTVAEVNAALAAVAFVPAADNAADTAISTQIRDAAGTGPVDGSITLDVTPVNDAPTYTKGTDQVVPEDAPAQTIVGWATGITAGPIDESGQALAFNVTGNTNPELFAVAPAVAADGTLAYILTPNANGTAQITLTLADDGGTANGGIDTSAPHTFNITATAVNDAPVAGNDSSAVPEDQALQFVRESLVANDFDAENDTLTIVSVQGAQHGTVDLDAFQKTTFTPEASYNGPASFTYTISDGDGGFSTATVSLTVTPVNDAPVVGAAITDQAAVENAAFSFAVPAGAFVDIDAGDQLFYSFTLADGSPLPGWLSFDGLNTISGTPGSSDTGAIEIRVTATDLDAEVSQDFTLTVDGNEPPVIGGAIANQPVLDNATVAPFSTLTITDPDPGETDMTATVVVVETADGVFTPGSLATSGFTEIAAGVYRHSAATAEVLQAAIRQLVFDPTDNRVAPGQTEFTFFVVGVNDGSALAGDNGTSVLATSVNDAPVLVHALADQGATEDVPFLFQVPANAFADPDPGDTLTYSAWLSGVNALPSWLSFDAPSRTFTGTPGDFDVGTLTVMVVAADGQGWAASDEFVLTVANVNDAPVIDGTVASQMADDNTGMLPFGFLTVTDADMGESDLTVTVTLDDAAKGVFTAASLAASGFVAAGGGVYTLGAGTVQAAQAALHELVFDPTDNRLPVGQTEATTLTVVVDDGDAVATDATTTVVSRSVNDAPMVMTALADQGATEDVPFLFQVPANAFADPDPGDTLTYSAWLSGVNVLPSWLSFDAPSRTFTGTPGDFDVGTLTVMVVAADGQGWAASDEFVLTVANVNNGPINGTPGDDTLTGTPGDDVINGLGGNDFIQGLGGDDLLDGGEGNDDLVGGDGSDTYLWGFGSGGDSLSESSTFSPGTDVLQLGSGVLGADLEFRGGTFSGSLVIALDFENQVTLRSFLDGGDTIDVIRFADGSEAGIFRGDGVQTSYVGADNVDVFIDSLQTETFFGGQGNDLYVHGAPGGFADTINDLADASGGNHLLFTTLMPSVDLTIGHRDGYLLISADGAEIVRLSNFDRTDVYGSHAVERYGFMDGSSLSYEQLLEGGFDIVGGFGFDELHGTNIDDRIYGLQGNDQLWGYQGSDNLFGGVGTDQLDGGDGDDYLEGGEGHDVLLGEDGSDLYYFDRASGHDWLLELVTLEEGADDLDAVSFGPDIMPEDLVVSLDTLGRFLVSIEGSDASILFNAWFDTDTLSSRVERFFFQNFSIMLTDEDVTAMLPDAPVVVNPLADQAATEDAPFSFVVPGDAFDDADIPIGDSLDYSASLADGSVLPSWLAFDANTRTFSGTPANGNVGTTAVRVTVTDEAGLIASDVFELAVANTNDAPTVAAPLADQSATVGTGFSYTMPAGSFADVDVGDTLAYAAARPDGTALPSWITFDPLTRSFSGTPGSGDVAALTVRVTASDGHGGSVFDEFTLSITGGGTVINGTAGNDTLNGTGGPDLIYGFGGDDVLNGFDGDDTLTGGAGGDAMYGGAGDDLFVFAGSDSPWDQVNGGAGFDQILGSAGDDTIRLWDYVGPNRVERIDGGAGVNVIMTYATSTILDLSATQLVNIARIEGAAGHDTITGSAGDDVIQGGAGGDAMYGGAGDDLFLFAGSDSPWDQVNGGSGFDQILGSAGDDTIRLWDYYSSNTVERIDGGAGVNVIMTYATSTTLDLSGTQLVNIARIQGDAGNDTLTGSAGNDVIDGGAGNDTMAGGTGDDTYKVDSASDAVTEALNQGTDTVIASISYTLPSHVEGLNLDGLTSLNGTGNVLANTVNGNPGANVLDGRAGADMLFGGAGDDIFAFRAGEAQGDAVLDFAGNGPAAGDALQFTGFGAGATLTQNGTTDYWTIHYGNTAETLQLVGVTALNPGDYTIS